MYVCLFPRPGHNIVMEYCTGYVDLFRYIDLQKQFFTEKEAAGIIHQTLSAISYCKAQGVDHRDIKDENILYHPKLKAIKIIDFGSASKLQSGPYKMFRGTDVYIPPEWHLMKQYTANGGAVWAVGCLTFILLNGDSPFDDPEQIKYNEQITWKNYNVSAAARRFIRKCLCRDPLERETLNNLPDSRWLRKVKL